MKTSTRQNPPEKSGTLSRLTSIVMLLAGTLLTPPARADDANEKFQYNTLFSPTPAQLKAEGRGRVMIYDGLDNAVVERALDEQFDRIEHMMFTRIRDTAAKDDGKTPDGGENDSGDDDGC
jgi:hypothetical protein